jgi:2-phosphosulfolactate phosphatase
LAEYVKAKLMGGNVDFEQMKALLRVGDGARLLNPANHEWSPATDFDLCLDLDRFDFVLGIRSEDGIDILRKV